MCFVLSTEMDGYWRLIYITVEQENAIRCLFSEKDWYFKKLDLTTNQLKYLPASISDDAAQCQCLYRQAANKTEEVDDYHTVDMVVHELPHLHGHSELVSVSNPDFKAQTDVISVDDMYKHHCTAIKDGCRQCWSTVQTHDKTGPTYSENELKCDRTEWSPDGPERSPDGTKWSTDATKQSLDEMKPPDEIKWSTDGPENGTTSEYPHVETGCQSSLVNKVSDTCPGNDSVVEKSSDFEYDPHTCDQSSRVKNWLNREEIKRRLVKGDQSFIENRNRRRNNCNVDVCNVKPVETLTKVRSAVPNGIGKKHVVHCNDCKVSFTSQRRFNKHKERNGGQCVFACEYCGKVFLYRKSRYELHVRSAHTKERPFKCEFCGKGYVTSDKLKIHQRSHTGEKPCICEQCGCAFYSRGELSVHREYHHNSKQHLDDYRCNVCNMTFCSQRYLVYHKNVTHSNRRDFQCSQCPQSFKCNTALQRHKKYVHTDNRDYKCDDCNKFFKSPGSLRKHALRHNGEKTFFCTECNKAFYEKSKLTQHVRIHTGEKPYQCNMCDYSCALSGNLTKHKNTHYKQL